MPNTYPNQEIIVRRKDMLKDADHPYAKVNIQVAQDAMKELKGYEFQLYMLLTMNQIDFEMAFSPLALSQKYGGSDKTWRSAKKTLIDKGYLVETSSKHYEFMEIPVRKDKWDF